MNEATQTDLKVIEELQALGWKRGDTLHYQQEYALTLEQQEHFVGKKSVKPDITLTDMHGNVLAIFENKLKDETKGLTKLRTLYAAVIKPRFLYACSPNRTLFYDTEWRGLDGGEFKETDFFMSPRDMQSKIEQAKQINLAREIVIDESIAGGINPSSGLKAYYQLECVNTLIQKYKEGKQKMLVHMATGLGKTRTAVALVKALLEYGLAKRVLFVVDRVLLAEQALNDGFSLINREFSAVYITSGNYNKSKHAQIHVVVIDTLENIFAHIPRTFYDLIIVDECHRSTNIKRKLMFDRFMCPRIGLTATPRKAVAKKGTNIPNNDLAILDTYHLFGCEDGVPDYQFDLQRGIKEGFLASYKAISIETKLVKIAKEVGVEFDHYIDPKTDEIIDLDREKRIYFDQLNRRFIAWENCLRVAEELKEYTEREEKVIVFGVSQQHCVLLTKAINQVFRTADDEMSPRYAEAVISDNNDLNATFKRWFKAPFRKPYITVSVDIMSTGVDIPCVRYIAFVNPTKSVGKYIQMLGRGTRLDPKTGKYSFTVLDFVDLCQEMQDNGMGTLKENVKIISEPGGTTSQGTAPGSHGDRGGGIIDNPDPAESIQRVYLHGDSVEMIDNIPIEEAKKIFQEELKKTREIEITKIKRRVLANADYQPTEDEIRTIRDWARNPIVYLDEGQLQKIYAYEQGSYWDFFLHALEVRNIPTPQERIEKGFEAYIDASEFNDEQIEILHNMRDIISANIVEKNKNKMSAQEIFGIRVYENLIGKNYQEVNRIFNNQLAEILSEIQNSFEA